MANFDGNLRAQRGGTMLTPVEIQNKEFGRGWRGYREGEVRAFLEQIVAGYQELYQENQELREQVARLEQALKKYQEWEQTLRDTLVLAQKAAEEARSNAEREGELIRQEARRQAEEMLAAARAEVERLNRQYENLKERAAAFRRRWLAFLQAEVAALQEQEGGAGDDTPSGAGATAGQQG